jgi:hypothetical protein
MSKSAQICTRVTPEVMTNLRVMAEKQSMLLSRFVRWALAEKVKEQAAGRPGNDSCYAMPGHGRAGR